ncbi:MAG TPA: SAM-dependent methyltransferase [Spongiibacteraceae bacterium]|nr:SAM-dependent methyltransferase [Spongiibacteraceae bacterium]
MPTDNPSALQQFLILLDSSLRNQRWVKLLLSKYRGAELDLQRLTIRPIVLRDEPVLSFIYSYKTRDVTKNFTPDEGLATIQSLLGSDFKNAYLVNTDAEIQLEISKKGKAFMQTHTPAQTSSVRGTHDRTKKRFVDINRNFLAALGITDQQRQLIPAMASKWKQINKFIEVFDQALRSSGLSLEKPLTVVDFGSGKGYLTFALHDYLQHVLHNNAAVTGVELREALVTLCNNAAATLEHAGLTFVCGDVKTHAPKQVDVMIALHACDTATDYAINYGIRAQASIIMCSPCCHKQIRPQIHSPALLQPMLQYGVHLGQQAEMVTDSLRALLLEANGYSTKVFEFISLEHTDKNKMILAVKNPHAGDNKLLLEQIAAIKTFYGIDEHCLESLLREK